MLKPWLVWEKTKKSKVHFNCITLTNLLLTKFQNCQQGQVQNIANKHLTHSHTMTPFDVSGKEQFSKHCGEKEKMLATSIFSFSHNVFYTIKETEIIIYVTFILLSANALNLDKVKFLLSGNGLKKLK